MFVYCHKLSSNTKLGFSHSMPESNLPRYIWNEYIEPIFMVPLFPFAIAASILNGRLQRVPERSIDTVRRRLRLLFALTIAICFGISFLMVLAGLDWLQVAFAGTVAQHLLAGLGFFWLGVGCHLLYSAATYGNWQIRLPPA